MMDSFYFVYDPENTHILGSLEGWIFSDAFLADIRDSADTDFYNWVINKTENRSKVQ